MKTVSNLFTAILFICAFCLLSSAQNVPPEVLKAAQAGLPDLMHAVIPGYAMLGFDKNDSLQNVTLGKPFEFYTVIPKGKINTGVKCKSFLSNRKEYYFPIILDGQIKSILNVYKRKKDSTWVASGIGNEILARELFVIRKQWPNEKGFNPYILEFPTIQKVYFSIPEVDDKNMTEIDINNKIDSSSSSNSNNLASPRSVSLNYAKLNNIDMVLDTINARASHIGSPNKNCPTCSN